MINPTSDETAEGLYKKLAQHRDPFLRRARDCAKLTIPHLVPPDGMNSTTTLPTPFQSHGARGLRTLASKLLLSLFPNFPFFKRQVDDLTLRNLEGKLNQPGLRGDIEKAMSARERATMLEVESSALRPSAFSGLLQLLVAGNAVIYIPQEQDEGLCKVYRLDQFVLRRAADGSLVELILQELVDIATLPPEIGARVVPAPATPGKGFLYTHIKLSGKKWDVYQEAGGVEIPNTRGSYPKDRLPWLAPRLSAQPGEEYGRSYVEEFLGDLDTLEALTQAIVDAASAAARVVYFVDPSGTTSLRLVASANSGDTLPGNAQDISMLRLDKGQDLTVVIRQAEVIATSLSYSFLMNNAIQRSGERVTAEEIRTMANELDTALGGIYSLLALELQLPIVLLLERRMEKNKKIPPLPDGVSYPVIVTGLEAIGRGTDQRNLKLFLQDVFQTIGPENALRAMFVDELIKRTAAAYGIDTEGLIKSSEQMQQEAQEAAEQEQMASLGPETIRQVGNVAREAMKPDPQGQTQ